MVGHGKSQKDDCRFFDAGSIEANGSIKLGDVWESFCRGRSGNIHSMGEAFIGDINQLTVIC